MSWLVTAAGNKPGGRLFESNFVHLFLKVKERLKKSKWAEPRTKDNVITDPETLTGHERVSDDTIWPASAIRICSSVAGSHV